ncbi:MAG: carboxypeptidase-like regulatory domain-containing protein, partial [Candidatus Korobacteraceae bacterium]
MNRSAGRLLGRHVGLGLLAATIGLLLPAELVAQGETTSAILGQVTDATNAAIPGATVTVINQETGLQRGAKTDDTGHFNFPQLKPGTYTVKVEAQGFESQQADNVSSGLGQKQTVNLTLRVAQSKQTVD